jgi:hypothetical protein
MPGMGYQQPQPHYQRELETLEGLKHINWGIILYIVATLLLLLTALVAVATAISVAGTSDPTPYLGALVGLWRSILVSDNHRSLVTRDL